MATYPFKEIETKWQSHWDSHGTFSVPAELDTSKPKYYVLDMFPYPSGDGLHVGHPEGYTATDIVARYKRMRGFNVLHPMGWDAFGLPAEQYALQTGTHPADHDRAQHRDASGGSSRRSASRTTGRARSTPPIPKYYRWTQWIFEAAVRARPRVSSGAAGLVVPGARHRARERGGHRRQERARRLPVRAPADAPVDAPDHRLRRRAARRSRRARLAREHEGDAARLDRPQRRRRDRLPGRAGDAGTAATTSRFACSPRGPTRCSAPPTWCSRPSIRSSRSSRRPTQRAAVEAYREQAARKSELERTDLPKQKTGVFTGAYAVNPVNGEQNSDLDRGLRARGLRHGRDHGRARARRARLRVRVDSWPARRSARSQPPPGFDGQGAYLGDGKTVNSGFLDGLNVEQAKAAMIDWLEKRARASGESTTSCATGSSRGSATGASRFPVPVRRRQAESRARRRAAGAAARARGLQAERLARGPARGGAASG